MSDYEWRFCPSCDGRIFKDEIEGDTIKTVSEILYCIDCANDLSRGDDMELSYFSTAFHGFITGQYDYNYFNTAWKEELHTPTLDYYFKSVKVNWCLYFIIKSRRKKLGLL